MRRELHPDCACDYARPQLVLAIDPGPETSGWVLFDGERVVAGEPQLENHRVLQLWTTAAPYLFEHGLRSTRELLVAMEWITSYGMAVGASVFETCFWAGRIAEALGGDDVQRIARANVKLHLCGSRRAKDTNIRQALVDRFGGVAGKRAAIGLKKSPGPLYGTRQHMWAALAVAITAWDQAHAPEE